jgi:hypothetical protein
MDLSGEGMKTATDRLRFTVAFAEMNLAHLREWEWSKLRDDLCMFLLGRPAAANDPPNGSSYRDEETGLTITSVTDLGGFGVMVTEPPWPEEYSREAFEILQAAVKGALLTAAAHGGHDRYRVQVNIDTEQRATAEPAEPFRAPDSGQAIDADAFLVPVTTQWMVFGESESLPPVLVTTGAARDVFLMKLFFLMLQHGCANIKSCPECGRLFWRVRRQKYCSRTCVNRVNMREWTRSKREQAARRAASRQTRTKRAKKGGRK